MRQIKAITCCIMMLLSSYALAETCNEAKSRWIEMKSLNKEKVENLYSECVAKDKRDNEFNEWVKSKPKDSEVWFLSKNIVLCFDREKFISVFNQIQVNGGNYNPNAVRNSGGCPISKGWSFGRIMESPSGSNVIKVQYRTPFTNDQVREVWLHRDTIETLENYKKRMAY